MACFAQWNLPDIKHLTGAKDKRGVSSVCFRRLLVISDRPWHATMSLLEGAIEIFTRSPTTSVAGKLLWTLSPGNWPKRAPYVIIYPPPGPTTGKLQCLSVTLSLRTSLLDVLGHPHWTSWDIPMWCPGTSLCDILSDCWTIIGHNKSPGTVFI